MQVKKQRFRAICWNLYSKGLLTDFQKPGMQKNLLKLFKVKGLIQNYMMEKLGFYKFGGILLWGVWVNYTRSENLNSIFLRSNTETKLLKINKTRHFWSAICLKTEWFLRFVGKCSQVFVIQRCVYSEPS